MDAIRAMRRWGLLGAALASAALVLPAAAAALPSTIAYDGTSHDITYADPSGNTDRVGVEIDTDPSGGGQDAFGFHLLAGGLAFQQSNGCTTITGGVVVCPLDGMRLVFDLAAGDDAVDLGSAELTATRRRPSVVNGGIGNDRLVGGALGDDFTAGSGDDRLVGLTDGDRFAGGDGRDTLELSAGGPWLVTLDGIANDGAGAGSTANVHADVEVVLGGPGRTPSAGAPGAQSISGGAGNDTLAGGADADQLSGDAGADVIRARDGSADTVACGIDGDTVTADWNDAVAADCESVSRSPRDDDGDGTPHDADCNDADPAIRPSTGDIPGNGIVFPRWTIITKLTVRGAPAGAKLRVRCEGKGCPVRSRAVKLRSGRAKLTKLFKRAKLRRGAVVELRLTAPGAIGKVLRLAVRKRKAPKRSSLCLPLGASKPARC